MASTVERPNSPSSRPTRRTLLAGAALVAPASLLPAIAAAASGNGYQMAPDPHPGWYAEWRACLDYCNHADHGGRELAVLPEWARVDELEELIGTTPARTLPGALAQLRVANEWLGGNAYCGEALDAAVENAIATLERLAGEAIRV